MFTAVHVSLPPFLFISLKIHKSVMQVLSVGKKKGWFFLCLASPFLTRKRKQVMVKESKY
jgi:hypothetical protein